MCMSARACVLHVNALTTTAMGSVHAYITPPDSVPHSKPNRINDGDVENDATVYRGIVIRASTVVCMQFCEQRRRLSADFVCRRMRTKRAKFQNLRTFSARMQNASSRVAKLYLTDESRRRCLRDARSTFFYGHAHPARASPTPRWVERCAPQCFHSQFHCENFVQRRKRDGQFVVNSSLFGVDTALLPNDYRANE